MKKILCLFLMLLLSGCAMFRAKSIEQPTVELVKGQMIVLPTLAQLKFNLTATQILTAKYNFKHQIKIYSSQVQVEKTPRKLVLVAVAGWGGEIFSIYYDGMTIRTSSLPMPNVGVGIKHVLSDFILTYADPMLLQKILKSTQLQLIVEPKERMFLLHNKPVITITYQNKNPWQGRIVLQNLYWHYKITIKTISYHMG